MKIEYASEFEGSPDPMWYFARGHIDKENFMFWLRRSLENNAWRLNPDLRINSQALSIENVSLEWWHFYPTGLKDPKGAYAQVDGPGRGNFPVTVYNVDYRMGDSEDIGLVLHEATR